MEKDFAGPIQLVDDGQTIDLEIARGKYNMQDFNRFRGNCK